MREAALPEPAGSPAGGRRESPKALFSGPDEAHWRMVNGRVNCCAVGMDRMIKRNLLGIVAGAGAAAMLATGGAAAHPEDHESGNGAGYDADGDTNPAVNTKLIARIGDAAEAALDPPFKIITFEAGAGHHGDVIRAEKIDNRTVRFSPGLKRQLCTGQHYFDYDTECTYMAAPSGKFAAVYRDEFHRPLEIEFEQPVCAAAIAIYPTGGGEGETFKVVLAPFDEYGGALEKVEYEFNWTRDTFRWRLMAGAFFLEAKAKRLAVNVESKKDKSKNVRFLIDDVAFIEDGCGLAIDDINAEGGLVRAEAAAPAEPTAPVEPAVPASPTLAPEEIIPEPEEIEGS